MLSQRCVTIYNKRKGNYLITLGIFFHKLTLGCIADHTKFYSQKIHILYHADHRHHTCEVIIILAKVSNV